MTTHSRPTPRYPGSATLGCAHERARRPGREGAGGPRLGGGAGARSTSRSRRWASSCATEIAAGRGYLPAGDQVLRAFSARSPTYACWSSGRTPTPPPATRSASASPSRPDVWPLPQSLVNIFTRAASTTSARAADHGDLTPWADAGRDAAQPDADGAARARQHRTAGKGWEPVTERAIDALAERGGARCAAVLWGRDAQALKPLLGECRGWSRSTRPRCRPAAGSSAPGPSAGSTGCWRSRAARRSTGACPGLEYS